MRCEYRDRRIAASGRVYAVRCKRTVTDPGVSVLQVGAVYCLKHRDNELPVCGCDHAHALCVGDCHPAEYIAQAEGVGS